MHVHANQINSYTQLDSLYAAETAAAKRAAENTRKKLRETASKLNSEFNLDEACVVKLGSHEESEEQTKRQNQQQGGQESDEEGVDSDCVDSPDSDWV